MINLLPQANKRAIAAARSNSLLARYNLLLFVAAGFMIAAITVVYIFFSIAKQQAEDRLSENTAKAASFSQTNAEATEFRKNLASAKQILSGATNYPQMMIDIAKLLPNDIVLQELSLDTATFGKPTTLTARAKSYEAILALKENLQKSPMFSDVNLQSVTDTQSGAYPLTATLNVTFAKGALR